MNLLYHHFIDLIMKVGTAHAFPTLLTAVLNDLQKINPKKLDLDDGYFVGEFFNRGLDIKPNKDDVQKANYTRGEVFAQLFAYAMGTDDGKKDKYLQLFPNTYKVVKNYIAKHSKK